MGNDSPLLEPVKFIPGVSPEPSSAVSRPVQATSARGSTTDKALRLRRRPVQQTQSDAVIINFLGNHNFPHIAHQAFEDPLGPGSEGENEGSPSGEMNATVKPGVAHLRSTAEHALQRQGSMDGWDRSQSKGSAPLGLSQIMNSDNQHPRPRLDTSEHTLSETSVGRHMRSVPELSAGSTEPPSSVIKTPDTSRELPSIRATVGPLPPLTNSDRRLPPLPQYQSPSSALASPSAGLAALQFNSTKSATSTPASAFPASPPGPGPRLSPPRLHDTTMSPPSHPSALRPGTSPQTEPTPGSIYSASYSQVSPGESISSPDTVMQMDTNGRPMHPLITAPGMSPGVPFRCKVPMCNAPPFQTQYLLKSVLQPHSHPTFTPTAHPSQSQALTPAPSSHMNVHSSARPHYCPRKGCPRAEGGRGFKRKNEMIRHGLVHQSPGYACPFCPDREHKYPRPDNLQRHVKVHHVEKDKDDPVLREVLNQRLEGGGSRGRRKRANS